MADGDTGGAAPVTFSADPAYATLDAEMKGYFQNRGLEGKSPFEVAVASAKAHRGAEQHLGVPADQIVRVPKDLSDAAGWKNVWSRLGAGEKAEDYDLKDAIKFTKAAGSLDAALVSKLQESFVANGTPKPMATEIVKALRDFSEADVAVKAADRAAKTAEQEAALRESWGKNFDTNKAIFTNMAEKLGWGKDFFEGLYGILSLVQIGNALLKLAQENGEDRKFISGGGNHDGVLTREQAVERKAALLNDKDWFNRYQNGDVKAREEYSRLSRLAIGM